MDIKEEPVDPLAINDSFNGVLEDPLHFVPSVSSHNAYRIKTDVDCGPIKQEITSAVDIHVPKIKNESYFQTANQSNVAILHTGINNCCTKVTQDIANDSIQTLDKSQTLLPYTEIKIDEHDFKTEILDNDIFSNEEKQSIEIKGQFENSNFFVPTVNQNKIHNSLFKCDVCSFEHEELSELKRHEPIHNVEKVFVKDAEKPQRRKRKSIKKIPKKYDILVNENGKKIYECKECSFKSKYRSSMCSHVLTHNKMLKCRLCPYECKQKEMLIEHKLSHSNYSNEKESSGALAVNKTKPTADPDGYKHACDICPRKFKLKCKLDAHRLSHSTEKPFKCLLCPYAAKCNFRLSRHNTRMHSSVKPYNCDLCPYGSADVSSLKVHRRIHFPEKPFKCPLCDYTTVQRPKLRVHSLTHSKLKLCKCDLCPLSFRMPFDLRRHKLKVHSQGEQLLCDLCPFKTYMTCLMKHHKTKNHDESNTGDSNGLKFQCDQCQYTSNQKGNLKTHQRIHSPEKPYRCEICPYGSRHLATIKTHMKNKHRNEHEPIERKFKCDVCPYATVNMIYLKKHKMIHDNVKPFKCDLCDYATVQKPKLKIHRTVHFSEKPLKCDLCTFTCKQKTNLRLHKLRRHDGDKPHMCDVCSYKCGQLWQLNKHIKKNHQENM